MNFFTDFRRRYIMLTCEEINQFLVDYLEGELDEQMEQRFESHIEGCTCCNAFFEQYRDTINLVGEEKERLNEEMPDELAERTLEFLREHRQNENEA